MGLRRPFPQAPPKKAPEPFLVAPDTGLSAILPAMIRQFLAAITIGVCCSAVAIDADARVIRIEISKVEPAAPGFEKLSGKAYGELDPADPKNALITDIQSAPRNARGKVEYVATFALVKPVDMS